MAFFICRFCNKDNGSLNHVCNKEDILSYIEELKNSAMSAENKLESMQNAVRMVIQELPSLEGEKINVNAEWIRRLWNATNNCWYEAKSSEDFLVRWLVTHRILCEAYDVFRTSKYGHKETLLQKLTNLKKACNESQNVLGYQDSKLDLSPEDLVNNFRYWFKHLL